METLYYLPFGLKHDGQKCDSYKLDLLIPSSTPPTEKNQQNNAPQNTLLP